MAVPSMMTGMLKSVSGATEALNSTSRLPLEGNMYMERLKDNFAPDESSSLQAADTMISIIIRRKEPVILIFVFILIPFYWLMALLYSSHNACTSSRSCAFRILPVVSK